MTIKTNSPTGAFSEPVGETYGGVAERFKAPDLHSGDPQVCQGARVRGFESCHLLNFRPFQKGVQRQRTRLPSTRSHLYRAEPVAAGNSDQPLRSTTRGLAQVINLQVRYSDSGASRPVASCGEIPDRMGFRHEHSPPT
jgi:hypothetical protein